MHLNFELHMIDTNSVGPVSDVEIKIRKLDDKFHF